MTARTRLSPRGRCAWCTQTPNKHRPPPPTPQKLVYGEEQDEGWEGGDDEVDESFFAVDEDDELRMDVADLEDDIVRWKAELGLAPDDTQVRPRPSLPCRSNAPPHRAPPRLGVSWAGACVHTPSAPGSAV